MPEEANGAVIMTRIMISATRTASEAMHSRGRPWTGGLRALLLCSTSHGTRFLVAAGRSAAALAAKAPGRKQNHCTPTVTRDTGSGDTVTVTTAGPGPWH